ncbi:MAG: MMPL family transporter [Bacteroidota bacterium]
MGRSWQIIARIILKARIPLLVVVALATSFMWFNRSTERSHDFGKIIPQNDPHYVDYLNFRQEFGDDGNVLVIAFQDDLFDLEFFNMVYDLTDALRKVDGVTNVLSMANVPEIIANSEREAFSIQRAVPNKPRNAAEMDAVRQKLTGMPFYSGLLFNDSVTSTLISVTIDSKRLDTEEKTPIVQGITAATEEAAAAVGATPHYSGLPYVRAFVTNFIPQEMVTFLVIAVLVMAFFLYLTFRSFYAVAIPLLVIGVVIIWALGFMGLFGYKITALTAVLPSLIAVIGVPNSIYLLTKYHFEYKRSGNKIKSLVLVIQKIGIVTVMTNATTAVGFGVLAFTNIQILREFGILAGLSVVVTFFVSLLLIPIFFSFLPAPGWQQIRHTDRRLLGRVIKFLDQMVMKRRPIVYIVSIAMTAAAIFGMSLLYPRSLMVDDLPRNTKVIEDLHILEEQYKGVMPFEIVINTHRDRGILKYRTLSQLEEMQRRMLRFDVISRSLSILDLIKYTRQALLSGISEEYQLPSREEYVAIQSYVRNSQVDSIVGQATIFDSTYAKARIRANVKDVGARKLEPIIDSLENDLEELFVRNTASGRLKPEESYRLFGSDSFRVRYKDAEYAVGEVFVTDTHSTYEVLGGEGKVDYSDRIKVTGTTKIFIKSNSYLIRNLIQSLLIAFGIIALLMALLFASPKMVIIALVPNFLPLLLTAGIMGFAGIPLKPSTVLIFSVAFGIAVDDTIHFLARYRLARKTGDEVKSAVSNSFKDTGVSMIYTSIILFFGFVIFAFSNYGGTQALGQLTSITLLIALFTNLLLLPSLLVSFNRDHEQLPDGYINYDEEREEVQAIREFMSEPEAKFRGEEPEPES